MPHLNLKKIALSATTALLLLTTSSAVYAQDENDRTLYWGGTSFTEDSSYYYLGGVYALNGTLKQDGWLGRIGLGYGEYEYNTAAVAGLGVDGDVRNASVMFGYQKHINSTRFTGYLGGDYSDHDLSPNDPGNSTQGSETGVKVQAEMRHNFDDNNTFSISGNYSTAYDNYYGRTFFTTDLAGFKIGPEASVLGSESFDQRRAGLYVSTGEHLPVVLNFQAGQAWTSRRGDDSPYFGIGFSNTF